MLRKTILRNITYLMETTNMLGDDSHITEQEYIQIFEALIKLEKIVKKVVKK